MELFQQAKKSGIICNYGITDRFKSNYAVVDFILPLTAENATGMSLLAGVLGRGCKAYPEMDQIGRFLAKNYGAALHISAAKAGEMEILSFGVNYLNNDCAIDGEDIGGAVLSLLKELIFNPLLEAGSFNQRYVIQEKKNLEDKIAAQFNDKRIYSLNRCKALMCANEAYGIDELGDLELLASMDAAKLYAFYQKMLNEALVIIGYVGQEAGAAFEDLAEQFAAREQKILFAEIKNDVESVREIVEPMQLNQSKLNLGFRLGDAAVQNGAACRLFNVLYGGSANSKLFMNVREKLSLCYYCSSTIDRFKNVMFVSSGVESEKYEQVRAEIEAQLKAVACGDFSKEEFENAKAYLIDSIRGNLDNKSSIAASMVSNTLREELKSPEQEIEEIAALKKEDIIAIAQDIQLDTVYFLKGVRE
jgi:predicted Zn-dependent peptidase